MSATCFKCKKTGLEWLKQDRFRPDEPGVKNKYQLYDPRTGEFHDCKMTKEEYQEMQSAKAQSETCPHGILKTRYCPLCEDARGGE